MLLPSMGTTLALRAVGVLLLVGFVRFSYQLYRHRIRFRSIASKYGLPMIPHSFLFGHLVIAAKVAIKSPRNLATSLIPFMIDLDYPETSKNGFFYLDMWPISQQMIVVSSPELMSQFTIDPSLPKHPQMPFEFGPFSHGVDLVTSNGQLWKTWRSCFNPAFSAQNVQSYVPTMLEEYLVFKSKMESAAKTGETVRLDGLTMSLTVDIIGHAVLGARLHAQTTNCALYTALKRQIALLIVDYSPAGLAKLIDPSRRLRIWNNTRIMRKEVLPYILSGIQEHDQKVGGSKTIHSLAAKSYKKEHSNTEGEIDSRWVDIAINQFKMLLFAGHDTVSSTFCFVAALLHFHPDKMAKLRAELDDVLGTDSTASQEVIARSPEILNRLTYLTAIIKETLRLFGPVSGTVRQTINGQHTIHHPITGQDLPVWDFMLFGHQAALHRHPKYWPQPHEFIPERFLAREGDELYPHKNTWRPFELGARNCLGQEFAMTEMRLVLALALMEFDFEPMYDPDGPKYFGTVLYQETPSQEITMHPKDGMPVKVSLRKKA